MKGNNKNNLTRRYAQFFKQYDKERNNLITIVKDFSEQDEHPTILDFLYTNDEYRKEFETKYDIDPFSTYVKIFEDTGICGKEPIEETLVLFFELLLNLPRKKMF